MHSLIIFNFRKVAAACLSAATALLITACSPSSEIKPFVEYAKTGQKYPVTINGTLGSITLTKQPERVVVLGAGAADIVAALGVQPLAVEHNTWGGDEQGYMPWFRAYLEKIGKPLPPTLTMFPELDAEKLVSLQPDLIIAPQSGLSADTYHLLSGFAPVIAHPHQPWLTTADEQLDIIAAALGRQSYAQRLKAETEAHFAAFRRRHPQLQGCTFAYIYSGGREANLSLYVIGEPRVDALIRLGLRMPPELEKMPLRPGTWSVSLGLENADKLNDADILFTWFNSEKDQSAAESRPLYREIKAVKRGSYIPLLDRSLAAAMYHISPLSAPWGIERLEPYLTKAAVYLPKKGRQ
ncbi:iron-siderophore ABC transporter substrate-binding protein [Neisseria iguanae]|uniref:iron-siderophore ABC transporter substrate-binding protein n=1 Tax=Neisseria iguanae TaxID=90242 RepID=UPI0014736922|nr:iron-siderophore ABC transporter substrate-binding protein [Neisseria iguanae]